MAEGKGMSKGCTVALIVAGVILVLIIVAAIIFYVYWGDVVKTGVVTTVNETKSLIAENPPEGVDTTQYNALADAFVERFNPDSIKAEAYGPVILQFSKAIEDKHLTGDEVRQLGEAMIGLYPDLQRFAPQPPDESMEPDTTGTMTDSASGM